MSTIAIAPPPVVVIADQRVILSNISWVTYEALLADHAQASVPHLNYDRGVLEIVSPLLEHDRRNDVVKLLVNVVAEELGLDVVGTGSTTFRRPDLERGFEVDSSFYIQNATRILDQRTIDLATDPPPDLVVEIDLTHSSLDKLPIFAAFGVPEVWRHQGDRIAILILRSTGNGYDPAPASAVFPLLTVDALSRWWDDGMTQPRPAFLRSLRAWLRNAIANANALPSPSPEGDS